MATKAEPNPDIPCIKPAAKNITAIRKLISIYCLFILFDFTVQHSHHAVVRQQAAPGTVVVDFITELDFSFTHFFSLRAIAQSHGLVPQSRRFCCVAGKVEPARHGVSARAFPSGILKVAYPGPPVNGWRSLARTFHQLPTATADIPAPTAFRLVGLLNVVHDYACGVLSARALYSRASRPFRYGN